MADVAIELDLGTSPETQNEKRIIVFMAHIWFHKDIFAKLYVRRTMHRRTKQATKRSHRK